MKRNNPGCGCCGGDVLIWIGAQSGQQDPVGIGNYEDLIALYEGMGLDVHYDATWTGSIGNYSLVFLDTPASDPPFWSTITGGGWSGRLHVIGENFGNFTGTHCHDWINAQTAINGLTIALDSPAGSTPGTVEVDDLNAGMVGFQFAATSSVSGGTILSRDAGLSFAWLTHNKVGSIDWVLSGDSNHICQTTGTGASNVEPGGANVAFAENLWNVPL